MSNYTKATDFAAKDNLPTGDSDKIIKGSEFETEFDNISTAIATKADAASATLTGTTSFETLSDGTISVTAFVDEDDMSSNSATLLPTQQSVKAYVDSQVTAQDLDFQGDTGGALSIDLDSETLTVAGGTGIDTAGSANTLTVNIDSTVATLTGTQTLTNKTLTSPDVNTPDIDGGTIDGTVIGGTTAAAGSFTTVSATGNITVDGTVDGRDIATDGTKLDGIEASADVTDTANVTAAGALMDSEVTNLAQVKAFDSSDYATAAQGTTADSAMQDLVDDTTPQLGGDLDVNGNDIVTTSNGDITLAPNGTGDVVINDSELVSNAAGAVTTGASVIAKKSRGTVASPTAAVDGDDVLVLYGRGHDGTNYQNTAEIRFDVDGTVSTGNVPQKISFRTSSTDGLSILDRMTIKPDGKTGIGTASPSTLLDVNGTVTATGLNVSSIAYPTTDGTNGQVLTTDGAGTLSFADAGGGFDPDVDSFNIGNDAVSSGTNSVALGHDTDATGTGSVALGMSAQATATGATALGYLADATATYAISIGDSDAQATYAIAIGGNAQANTAATYGIAIGYNAKAQAANAIHINSSSSQTNRPTVAGNLVIETDDARLQYKSSTWSFFGGAVDMSGALSVDGSVAIENSSGFGVIEIGGSAGAYIDLKSPFSDDFDGRIITTGTGVQIQSGAGGAVKLQHQGGNDKVETTTAGITVTGDLKFATSGDGIDFSTTSDASGMTSELLDDYEEGTFTPTLLAATTNPTVTYTTQSGRYTKVGNRVTCAIRVTTSATSGGVGNLRIGGLPFTANSSGATVGLVGYSAGFGTNNFPTSVQINNSGSVAVFRLRSAADGTLSSIVNAASIGAAVDAIVEVTYETA